MTAVDYLLLGLVALSVLIGLFRGFLREAISLITWVLAVWAAVRFAPVLEPRLGMFNEVAALWLARGLLFIGVLVTGALINFAITLLVRGTVLSGADRVLGMLFGFGRAVLIVGVLVLIGRVANMQDAPWWEQSVLMPYGEWIANGLEHLAEQAGLYSGDLEAEVNERLRRLSN